MTKLTISKQLKQQLKKHLEKQSHPELVNSYLFFVEQKHKLQPVLFPKNKTIYQSTDHATETLEKQGQLWHETEIKIGFHNLSVNELTKKIYICPFTGKVFGDNTHPNPQDAIYDWVSKCPENTERSSGVRVKRFFVSEDPEVIKNYIPKEKKTRTKVVFSSAITGKLFNSKQKVIQEFTKSYLKPMTVIEVQSQNRFDIEESFLNFLQEELNENKISSFVEVLAEDSDFLPYVETWLA